MFAVLIVLTGIVGYITVFKPRNLSPEMAKALERSTKALQISREVQAFVTTDAFKDAVRDVIEHPEIPKAAGTALLEGAADALEDALAAGGEKND